jgi:hypothetical protein
MKTIELRLAGTAPYLQCRFSKKAMEMMKQKQAAGSADKNKKPVRKARDFKADYLGAMHMMNKKDYGIPAAAFRNAAISACRLVNFKMTMAKLSIFVLPDGYDVIDATPLVKIISGKPEYHESIGRNADGGCDIRIRAVWKQWKANVKVRFDEDQFSTVDVVNLFCRIGEQIGIGEGRHDSRNSAGMGMGTFRVEI